MLAPATAIHHRRNHILTAGTGRYSRQVTTTRVNMPDAADQPLMGQQPGDDARPSEEADLPDVALLPEKNLGQPGIYVWLLTFSAGISGLLFGCRCSQVNEMKDRATNMAFQMIPASSRRLWSRSTAPWAIP